jgi:hypothetical protein
MVPEKQIEEFVGRLRAAAGENLKSVILYGSAAAGDYVPKYSDVNLLCVLEETSFASIAALTPAVEWWSKQKHRPPMLLTADELRRGADVFSIEFLDMQQNHRLLWGEDLLKDLEIPMKLHRGQVEYELREKTILLRQRLLLVAGNAEAKWELLLRSVSAFGTLARHALIATGDKRTATRREAVQRLAAKAGFDPHPFFQLLDLREDRLERKRIVLDELFARYLLAVERLTAVVDAMFDE